jgi:hypothetical protein
MVELVFFFFSAGGTEHTCLPTPQGYPLVFIIEEICAETFSSGHSHGSQVSIPLPLSL